MKIIELSQLTLLNFLAIAAFSLAMMFHVIAYTTDHWCTFKFEGIQWNMGLWQGCWFNEMENTRGCTAEIFKTMWFTTGKSSQWHSGSQAMMTIGLVCLFLLELAIICYACVKPLERFRERLVGVVVGLAIASGFCHFIVLLVYGFKASGIFPDAILSWSFGVLFISFILETAVMVLIKYDEFKRYQDDNISVAAEDDYFEKKHMSEKHSRKTHNKQKSNKGEDAPYSVEDQSIGSVTGSVHTSFTSLPEYTRRPSFTGSIEDSCDFSESTTFTTLSYGQKGPYYSEGSIESLV